MNVDTNAGCFNPHYHYLISQVVPSCHSHVCVLEIKHAILTLMLAAPPRDQALQRLNVLHAAGMLCGFGDKCCSP